MPRHFIRNLTGKHRTRRSDTQLGIALSFVAGAINAGGFLAVGYYTSHMTGIVSSVADFIALNQMRAALISLSFLGAFVIGSVTSALVMQYARSRDYQSEFALPLMIEAWLLLVFGVAATYAVDSRELSVYLTIFLLCYIMGLQNAMITRVSNATIRTTHVTGLATDIGIETGKYIFDRIGGGQGAAFHPERLRLYAALLASFLIGGIIGAFLFKFAGFVAAVPFSLLLAVMASVPVLDDILPVRGGR